MIIFGKPFKIIHVFLVCIILFIALLISVYIFGVKSEAYKYCLRYINSSEILEKHIGELKKETLVGYTLNRSGSYKNGQFMIKIVGSIAGGNAVIEIEKINESWNIVKAEIVIDDAHIDF